MEEKREEGRGGKGEIRNGRGKWRNAEKNKRENGGVRGRKSEYIRYQRQDERKDNKTWGKIVNRGLEKQEIE